MTRKANCLLVALLGCGAAQAQPTNWIYQNNSNLQEGTHYEIDQYFKVVTIKLGVQGETFDFEAVLWNGNEYVSPGDINLITADAGAGQVWITVMGNWNVYYGNEWRGARDVKHVNLGASGVTGQIGDFYLTAGLGADGDTVADTITGTWWVFGAITHDIVVGQFDAVIRAASFDGDLYATGEASHTGELRIGDSYAGSIALNGSWDSEGWLEVDGNFLGQINPTYDLSAGVLIHGYLGPAAVVDVGNDITGGITVEGNSLLGGGAISAKGTLTGAIKFYHTLACDVSVGGVDGGLIIAGWLGAGNLSGSVQIENDLGGLIQVNGDTTGAISVGQCITPYGGISIQADLNADLSVGKDVYAPLLPTASVWVAGNAAGVIEAGGNVLAGETSEYGGLRIEGDMTGAIHVGTDVSAVVFVGGLLWDTLEDVSGGHIYVNGSLTSTGRIEAHDGYYGSTEFVTIDYDGWDDGDDWESGGVVKIGNNEYSSAPNDPDIRVWEVTCQKGDLDNSGQVDAADIDPFILALTDPDRYGTTWSGLAGSRIYHGNCNCIGTFDAFDIDAFVLRLTNPPAYYAAYPGCEECPAPDNFEQSPPNDDDSSSPEAVAALLRDNVAPERLPVVIEIAAELASAYADTPRGEFWAAVLAELE